MKKIAWIDLETTGLNPRCAIIEVACVVTDHKFNKIDDFEMLVKPNWDASVEPFALDMHNKSGLWDLCRFEGVSIEHADLSLSHFLMELNRTNDPYILGGQSVHFDRSFIENWMPKSNARLSHRQIDVSGLKLFFGFSWGVDSSKLPPIKSETTHRALEDIEASIEGVKWYRQHGLADKVPYQAT